jgi:hypothetical protein
MFRRFGFAGGFLRQRELTEPIFIEPSNIISHVAATPVDIKGYPLLHILPMDRVCLSSKRRNRKLTTREQLMQTSLIDAELIDDPIN